MNNKPEKEAERNRISRTVLNWLDTLPKTFLDFPSDIKKFDFEIPKAGKTCMVLSEIQAASIVKSYITGGYKGEYQFKIVYRIFPGGSAGKILDADELLNNIGTWAENNPPDLSPLTNVRAIEVTQSAVHSILEDGTLDTQIYLKLTYEVI